MESLFVNMESVKFRWFVILQIVVSFFCLFIYFYNIFLFEYQLKFFYDLFELWSEFTWTNIGLYMSANTATKYVTIKATEFKRDDLKNKKTQISYKIFKTFQVFVTILIGYYLYKSLSGMSWEEIVKTMELYVEFTWVNVGIFYTGNVTSKYNTIKANNTPPPSPPPSPPLPPLPQVNITTPQSEEELS